VNAHNRAVQNPFSPLSEGYKPRLLPGTEFLDYKVNVWHLLGHKPECSDKYSLRNTPNVGMFTGEEIESGWADLDHLQYQTREMNAGARVDMITAHMMKLNEEKSSSMGKTKLYLPTCLTMSRGQAHK
jgi:hypothetical protein